MKTINLCPEYINIIVENARKGVQLEPALDNLLKRLVSAIKESNVLEDNTIKEIGEDVNKTRGFVGMQTLWYYLWFCKGIRRHKVQELQYIWEGIGEWRA